MARRANESGLALLSVMLVLFGVSALLMVLSTRMVAESHNVRAYALEQQLAHNTDNGVMAALARLRQGEALARIEGSGSPRASAMAQLRASNEPICAGAYACLLNWKDDNLDNNGDGKIDDAIEAAYRTVFVRAVVQQRERFAEVVVRISSESADLICWTEWLPSAVRGDEHE